MQRLLAARPDLDAVFANSDLMAAGAINVLHEQGRRVPEDVAVVVYDDLSMACGVTWSAHREKRARRSARGFRCRIRRSANSWVYSILHRGLQIRRPL